MRPDYTDWARACDRSEGETKNARAKCLAALLFWQFRMWSRSTGHKIWTLEIVNQRIWRHSLEIIHKWAHRTRGYKRFKHCSCNFRLFIHAVWYKTLDVTWLGINYRISTYEYAQATWSEGNSQVYFVIGRLVIVCAARVYDKKNVLLFSLSLWICFILLASYWYRVLRTRQITADECAMHIFARSRHNKHSEHAG